MKTYKIINIQIFAMLLLFTACDSVLDSTPQDKYAADIVWQDMNLIESYLLDSYDRLGIGFEDVMLHSVTDEIRFEFSWGPETYVTGEINADNVQPWGDRITNWPEHFNNIQRLNVFIANVDKVLDGAQDQAALQQRVDVLTGEALFLRAFAYSMLARDYGGLPIIKEPFEIGDDYSSITRSSYEETVDFISQELDASAALLRGPEETEMGKATKGTALALKSRVLLFAASDLTADGNADNELVGYQSPDRTALWSAARDAAKDVIDLQTYDLADFGAPDQEAVSQNYYELFRAKDLSSIEVIWGKMYSKSSGPSNQMNLWNGPNGNNNWAGHNPTQDLVDTYHMEDGTEFFDHYEVDGNGLYQNISNDFPEVNPYTDRDPRFYGSILYDQAVFQPRFSNLADRDPVGVYDRRTRINMENGEVVSQQYGIDTQNGPVEAWNGSFTGYVMRKFLDHEIQGRDGNNDNAWIEFRYAEILLNYAEALIELGETGDAADYINMIRNRAGMPDFTGDITEALRYERQVELAFEGQRWSDIRRWKVLEEKLTDARGIDIVETTEGGNVTTTWREIIAEQRNVFDKMYWIPIATDELNRAPQLIQNPDY
ncbi:MAG: RagB/SusD family nutrient uptake outer membrane protein [Balneolales bacterium]